jgi:hypothetical protein
MKKYTTVLLTLLAIVSFVSCDKKDDPAEPQKTKTDHITASSWKLSAATANGISVMAVPQISCMIDNTGTFVKVAEGNGTGTIAEGTTICTPTTAGNFTWTFQTNETILNMSATLIPGGSGTFNIQTLNATNMVLQQNMTLPVIGAASVVLTFIH